MGRGATCIKYADELIILVRGKFPDVLSDLINNFFWSDIKWPASKYLGINVDKSILSLKRMVYFSKRKKENQRFFSKVVAGWLVNSKWLS